MEGADLQEARCKYPVPHTLLSIVATRTSYPRGWQLAVHAELRTPLWPSPNRSGPCAARLTSLSSSLFTFAHDRRQAAVQLCCQLALRR